MSVMFRIRVLASRKAWLLYRRGYVAHGYYLKIEAYECRRNGTERYTPY